MASSRSFTLSFFSLFITIQTLCFISQASVPPSATFRYVNDGEFGDYVVEYRANYRVLSIATTPFQLCFYNTTPNAFTLALRMGTVRSESLMRWVWEANRGKPVGENATFSFGADGNLVLAHANGRVAWQSNTANKGVTGFELLPNGNMILHDSRGNYIWQSFDYPTDTLLVGQSLRVGGPTKLVSRASAQRNVDGAHSLVLEPNTLNMYYKSTTSSKPQLYYTFAQWFNSNKEALVSVRFDSQPESEEAHAYNLILEFHETGSTAGSGVVFRRPKFNTTLTYMRLTVDGNLRFYSFYDRMEDVGGWEEVYTLFDRGSEVGECQLPERCGRFGLCEESQCVGCPTPKGLTGWSRSCGPPRVSGCGPNAFRYSRLEGVEHFTCRYSRGDGPIRQGDCERKCSRDCKCMGYFYHQETSMCWIAYDLKTLTKVANSRHLGFIKVPNN